SPPVPRSIRPRDAAGSLGKTWPRRASRSRRDLRFRLLGFPGAEAFARARSARREATLLQRRWPAPSLRERDESTRPVRASIPRTRRRGAEPVLALPHADRGADFLSRNSPTPSRRTCARRPQWPATCDVLDRDGVRRRATRW